MYFTGNDFVISGHEIFLTIIAIFLVVSAIRLFIMAVNNIVVRRAKSSDDYPGSTKYEDISNREDNPREFSDIADIIYERAYLDDERREKVIFEENICGVPFRYDEKTRVLTIGEKCVSKDTFPVEIKLNSFNDLKEFVYRLEDYVKE